MKILVFILFFISTCFGEDLVREDDFKIDSYIFETDAKFYSFNLHLKHKFYLSSHCYKKENICLAKDALFKKINIKTDIPLNGGVNLGTTICVKYLSGSLLTMKNKFSHRVSICEFSDKSKVSTGILENFSLICRLIKSKIK